MDIAVGDVFVGKLLACVGEHPVGVRLARVDLAQLLTGREDGFPATGPVQRCDLLKERQAALPRPGVLEAGASVPVGAVDGGYPLQRHDGVRPVASLNGGIGLCGPVGQVALAAGGLQPFLHPPITWVAPLKGLETLDCLLPTVYVERLQRSGPTRVGADIARRRRAHTLSAVESGGLVPSPAVLGSARPLDGGWRTEGEELADVASHVEHRGDPLQAAGGPEDRDPPAARSLVHTAAMGNRSVEATGERDRCGVADGELHRRHGADPAAGQRSSSAGEKVLRPGLPR